MFLPEAVKIGLMLNLKNPQWWQFFTSAFIHQGWSHLIKNLIGYFLFVFPLFFIIATRTEKKKYYFRFLIFIILTFPLVESIFQFNVYPKIFPNLIYSSGISGIVAAFAGLIPSFWFLGVLNKRKSKISKDFALVSLTYVFLIFSIIYLSVYKTLFIIVIWGTLFVILLFKNKRKIFYLLGLIDIERERNLICEVLLLIVPVLFLCAPFLFFPPPSLLNENKALIDFFVHYLEISYGLISSFWFFIFTHKEKSPD